jgi:hypothetical protein
LSVMAISCLGLTVFHRIVDVRIRSESNELVLGTITVIGTAYAVLIAFIAVATWQAHSDGETAATVEANAIGTLYQDVTALPQKNSAAIQDEIRAYLKYVMDVEWPAQKLGQTVRGEWLALQKLNAMIINLDVKTAGEAVVQTELIRGMNDLYNARRVRQLAAKAHIPEVIWYIILFGTAATIGFTYFFGVKHFRMHLAVTGAVAGTLTLVTILVISLDRPFRGDSSISTEAYESVLTMMDAVSSPKP